MTERKDVEGREIEFFASYYEGQPYNPTGWRLRMQRELRALLRLSGQRRLGRVLSIGCGDGQFELMLAPHAEHVTGLDISPEAVASAQRNAAAAGVANATFRCQSFSDLVWDETYDVITCIAFLHHVPEPELPTLLRQAHQHLAPGGCFFAVDPNVNAVLRKIGRVVMGNRYDQYHSPDERELDPADTAAQLRAAGFADARVDYLDLTLIPALYILAQGPGWPMYVCAFVDWLWRHTPLARWASGFTAFARRAGSAA